MGHWDRLWLFEHSRSPQWVGKDFATIAAERGQHPFDAILDLLLEAGEDAPNVLFIGLVQTQEDLDTAFAAPFCSPESDATTLATDGPLAHQRFLGAYTWAANYLRTAVRERRVVTLEDAIHRMTELPARRVGLHGRGTLTAGARRRRHHLRPGDDRRHGHGGRAQRLRDRRPRRPRQRRAGPGRGGGFVQQRTGNVLRRSNGGTR